MLDFYHSLTRHSAVLLNRVLKRRLRRGKEDPLRLGERMGEPGLPRPRGRLVWFHAASVGEAQSTLILVNALLDQYADLHVLVTTGTVTSATVMKQRLPDRAIHQFYPLDHPEWVESFLNHWAPDMAVWMESELWPNMLRSIRDRNIHCVLLNAHMSPRSFRRWQRAPQTAAQLLSVFDLCLAQTQDDAGRFSALGTADVRVRDNVKYSAAPLPHDPDQYGLFRDALGNRPVWLYASTHDGEEDLACRIHTALRNKHPGLLTMIVPRHPERGAGIEQICRAHGLSVTRRGKDGNIPRGQDDIFIADTMGELGLFYRLSPIACIGRTFSLDGGGGHNPVEAAQLGCAVLHGPNIQNLAQIFAEMNRTGAATEVKTEGAFVKMLDDLFTHPERRQALQEKAQTFTQEKGDALSLILRDIEPLLAASGIHAGDSHA